MKKLTMLSLFWMMAGCQSVTHPPLATVTYVDLPRFMGDWYVIANIPTFIEQGAHNAVESYRLDADGTVATTFTFRAGGFDGPVKRFNPRGFVVENTGNAEWGMRFVWPFKSEYRITYLNESYSQTVIGRTKRDYVWIMSRSPIMSEADYQRLVQLLADQGYDVNKLQKVPQHW